MKNKKIITVFLVIILMLVFSFNISAVTDSNIVYRYNITNNEFLQNDVNFPSYCYNLPVISTENVDDYALSFYYKHSIDNKYFFYHYIFRNDTLIEKKYDNNNIYIFFNGYRKSYLPSVITKNSYGQYSNSGSSWDSIYRKYLMFVVFDKTTKELRFWSHEAGYNGNVLSTLDANILNYPNIKYTQVYNLLRADFTFNYDSFNHWESPLDFENPRTLYGRQLIDKQAFIDWIITNNKHLLFVDYGISTSSDYVEDLINLYESNNPVEFFSRIPSFLIDNQSIFSSVEVARGLFNLLDNLYQEYKLSQVSQIKQVDTNSNLLPHHRIDSSTDIYIENATDTIDIKILRDILKTLIQTPYTIYILFDNYLFNLSSNISLIADYISQLPDYLSTLQYNKFAPLLENIGGDSIENITNYNIQNLYTLNDEHNPLLNLEVNINNKFPIINQTNNLVDFDNYIVDSPTAPVFTMKKPTISNDMKIISTEEEIIFADFSKLSTFATIVKSIISVFFLFYFIKWLQNYIPKLLAGYNETD